MEPTWNWKVPEGPTKIHENSGGVHQHLMSCAAKVLWHLGRSAMVVGEFFLFFWKRVKWMPYWNIGRWDEITCSSIALLLCPRRNTMRFIFSLKIICCMSLFYWILFLVVHLISFVICRLLGCVWWAKPPLVRLRIDAQHQLQGAAICRNLPELGAVGYLQFWLQWRDTDTVS